MLNIKQIQEIIPHRYPLLIDKIEDLEPGIKAVGYKNVTMNEYFSRPFPFRACYARVLIIEALAQVGAVCLLSLDELKGKIAYFEEKTRFREKVVPGDTLRLSRNYKEEDPLESVVRRLS